ncbi:unnamed protein product [Mycena citricolor]|uniref:Uncharacterized protein n=1 Tax=Mycena citricolor TaxID=2018698 RepID=A0AAD2HLB0_9AGAR|nr:unnamed protein product [Mycena citricolor]
MHSEKFEEKHFTKGKYQNSTTTGSFRKGSLTHLWFYISIQVEDNYNFPTRPTLNRDTANATLFGQAISNPHEIDDPSPFTTTTSPVESVPGLAPCSPSRSGLLAPFANNSLDNWSPPPVSSLIDPWRNNGPIPPFDLTSFSSPKKPHAPREQLVLRSINGLIPITYPATRPPFGQKKQYGALFLDDEELENTRRAIGQSGVKSADEEEDEEETENRGTQGTAQRRRKRMLLTAADYVLALRTVLTANPYTAQHGKKADKWAEIAEILVRDKDWGHKAIDGPKLQSKITGILDFHKHPKGKHKHLASVMGHGSGHCITAGALLDALQKLRNKAEDKTNQEKLDVQARLDKDRHDGDIIIKASMEGLCTRRRKRAAADQVDENNENNENDSHPPTNNKGSGSTTARNNSASSIDSTGSGDRSSKRRRLMDQRSNTQDKLLRLMEQDQQRRAKQDAEVADTLATFVKQSHQDKQDMMLLLREMNNGASGSGTQ